MLIKSLFGSAKILCTPLVLGFITAQILSRFNLHAVGFDFDGYADALITFTTGSMIAVFLALFHSENYRIKIFRQHEVAATTSYSVIIISSFLIVLGRAFVKMDSHMLGVGVDNLITCISTYLAVAVIAMIFLLISLYTKP